jgi:hypothetical protein
MKHRLTILIILTASFWALPSFAQESSEGLAAKEATNTKDKSGTNPINFQTELRFYNEYSWLNTAGDGNQNLATFEYRAPIDQAKKFQLRTRMRYNTIKADFNDDGSNDINDSGLGDIDFRILSVPYLKGANSFAYALEVFLNTASDETLGSGATAISPQVFYGRFFKGNPLPIYSGGGIFAPGIQWKVSIEEDDGREDINQIILDFYFVSVTQSRKAWFFIDPQIIIDNENDTEFAVVDFQFGWMLSKSSSVWITPAIGVGTDRPVDYGVEFGFKFIGF